MPRVKAFVIAIGAALVASATISTGASAAYAAGNPIVIRDGQAGSSGYPAPQPSPVQPNTQIEPSIAVNPADPNDVVTVFQDGRVAGGGDADNGFATTRDGGLTWTGGVNGARGNLPGLTKSAPTPVLTPNLCPTDLNPESFDRASDAVVAFGWDPSGRAYGGYAVYAQSLVFDDTTCNALPSGMALNVSYDGGLTWTNALIVQHDAGAGLNDKNWIVSDNSSALGHHRGRTYIVWDRVASVEVAYCDPDSPASVGLGTGCERITNWSSVGGNAFFPLFPGQAIGTMPVVLNDGSLGVIFNSVTSAPCSPTEAPNCPIAGTTINWGDIPGAGTQPWPGAFTPTTFLPVPIASYQELTNPVQYQRAGSLPQVAYDTTTNDVFVGWEDNRYRTDGGVAAGSSNQNDAVISVSHPVLGVPGTLGSWSLPKPVNHDPASSTDEKDFIDHWNTMIAVGGDGILRVGYRQRFEPVGMSPTAPFIDTYYQQSTDHGVTFTTPVLVNTGKATDPQFGAFSRNGLFLGDYQALAAGGFDQTYVTRDESYAPPAGGTCNTGPFTTLPATPCQNQQTWVAMLAPQQLPGVPELRFVPALVVVGAAIGAVAMRRRKRGAAPL